MQHIAAYPGKLRFVDPLLQVIFRNIKFMIAKCYQVNTRFIHDVYHMTAIHFLAINFCSADHRWTYKIACQNHKSLVACLILLYQSSYPGHTTYPTLVKRTDLIHII